MNKLLLVLALVGCDSKTCPVPKEKVDQVKENVESKYRGLRCIDSLTPGAVLCEDVESRAYICYSIDHIYPNTVVCLEGAHPGAASLYGT